MVFGVTKPILFRFRKLKTMIPFSPELVGYDSALEGVLPIHEMIGQLRRHGAFYRAVSQPYFSENGEGKLYEQQFKNKTLQEVQDDGTVIIADSRGRTSKIEPHKGGWKHTKTSTYLKQMYANKIESEEQLEAFGQHISYLRPAQEGELSSNIAYAYEVGEEIINNTWWNLEYWESASTHPGTHTLHWKLINGTSSWKPALDDNGEEIVLSIPFLGGQYADVDLARSVFAVAGDKPGLEDGVFTYDPSLKYARLRLELDFGRYGRRQIYNVQLA